MTGQSETKHTPGQLYFYELRDSLNDGLGYIRTDADTLEICHHGDSRRSADENRANAARIALTWNCHDELVADGQFLLDRLAEFESELLSEQEREWAGHVMPAIARFRAALSRATA